MEKTNTHYRSGVKRLLAFLLCAVCVFGMIPTQAFAFSPGQKASSWLGDQYVGSDGQHYYAPAPYTYLVYNSDGTMDVRSSSGGNAYRHYMLTASDGSSQQVYCVESGIAYNTSDNTYTSESGTNSNYLNLLPSEARRGSPSRRFTAGNPAPPSLCPALTRTIIKWRHRLSSGSTSSSFAATHTAGTGTAMQTQTSISA